MAEAKHALRNYCRTVALPLNFRNDQLPQARGDGMRSARSSLDRQVELTHLELRSEISRKLVHHTTYQ